MSNRPQKPSSVLKGRIDWGTVIIPFLSILALCLCFILAPDASKQILGQDPYPVRRHLRSFLSDRRARRISPIHFSGLFQNMGPSVSANRNEKPKYGDFTWSSMMFTAGLAADILFYSFVNGSSMPMIPILRSWAPSRFGPAPTRFSTGDPSPGASIWSWPSASALCSMCAAAINRNISEACRPLLGDKVDRLPGKLIDLLALFALLAGTATTFALATPLMAQILSSLFHLPASKWITIAILVITCIVYTHALLHGMKGISRLSASCMYLFFALLAYVLFAGGETRYILETGFSAIGNLVQNFFSMATYTDPQRTTPLPAELDHLLLGVLDGMVRGLPVLYRQHLQRTERVRQTILGGYVYSLSGTFLSFLILGNYSLGLQVSGRLNVMDIYAAGSDLYATILAVVETLPLAPMVMILLVAAMIAFYATSFDSIALVASSYTYRQMSAG